MTSTLPTALRRRFALLACALVAASALAADPPTMTAELVTTGLYLIEGGGANTLMRFSATGLIVVDGKSPGMYRELMSQIRKANRIGDLRMRVLILTGADDSKSGNLDRFTAAKVPIVAHESVKRALDARSGDPPPRFVTFEDKYPIRMGGVEVEVMHLASDGAKGYTIVYFPNLRVIAIGDLGDPSGEGEVEARVAALGRLLALDFDKAVPSRGAVLSRPELVSLRARLQGVAPAAVAK
jgi:glyoxylase-like metal-dependent hydrolase (beta-lactamase superfamily II)